MQHTPQEIAALGEALRAAVARRETALQRYNLAKTLLASAKASLAALKVEYSASLVEMQSVNAQVSTARSAMAAAGMLARK